MPEPTSKSFDDYLDSKSFDDYLDSLTPPEPADEGFSLKKLAKLGLTIGIRTGGAVLGSEGGLLGAGINGVADYLTQAVDRGTLNPMDMNKAQLGASAAVGAIPGGAFFKMVKGAPLKAAGMGLAQGMVSTEINKAAQDDPNNTNPQGLDKIIHPEGKVGLTLPSSWSPLEVAGAVLPAVLGGIFAGKRVPADPATAATKAEAIAAANAAQKVKETQFGTVYQSRQEAEELADLLGKHNRPATVVPTDKGYKLVPSDLEAQTPEFEGKVPVATKLTERNGKRTVAKVYGSPEEAARAAEASQDKMWDNTTKDLNAAEKNQAATAEAQRKARLNQQAMAGKVKAGQKVAQPPSIKVLQESIDGLEKQLRDPEMVSYHPTINRRLQLLKDEVAKLSNGAAEAAPVAVEATVPSVAEAAPAASARKIATGARSNTIPKGAVSQRMAELEGQLGEMEPPFPPNQRASPKLQQLVQRWEKLSKLYKTNQDAYKAGEGEGVDAAAAGRMLGEYTKANKGTITKMADDETLNLPENVAAIRDIAKQMGLKIAKTAPLEKVLDAIEKKGGPAGLIANQSGEVDPMLAARLGTAALGGVVGSTQDEDHPIRGALIGAGLGAAAPSLMQKGMSALENPGALTGALKSKLEQAVKVAPDVQRFNLLSRPVNLASNVVVGPWGAAFWKGLEHKMVNDPRGDEMLSNVLSTKFPKRLVEAIRSGEAEGAIGAAERAEKSVGEAGSHLEEFLAKPGELMTGGDQAARHLGEVSGFTPAEMRNATMTNEPNAIIGTNLNNFGKTAIDDGQGGKIRSTLIKLMLPFKRTSANLIDRGIERTPGIGSIYQRYGKAVQDRDSGKMQLVQQGLGGGVYTASFLAGSKVDPKDPNAFRYRKILADAAGPYSMLASAGFMAGMAKARGSSGMSPHLTGVSTAFGDMPLPTTRTPMELAKFGAGVLSGQAISKPLHPKSKGIAKYLPHGFYPGVLADVDEDTVKSISDFFK